VNWRKPVLASGFEKPNPHQALTADNARPNGLKTFLFGMGYCDSPTKNRMNGNAGYPAIWGFLLTAAGATMALGGLHFLQGNASLRGCLIAE